MTGAATLLLVQQKPNRWNRWQAAARATAGGHIYAAGRGCRRVQGPTATATATTTHQPKLDAPTAPRPRPPLACAGPRDQREITWASLGRSVVLPTVGAEHDAPSRTWPASIMHACELRTGCQPPSAAAAHVVHAASTAQGQPTVKQPTMNQATTDRATVQRAAMDEAPKILRLPGPLVCTAQTECLDNTAAPSPLITAHHRPS